MAINSDLGHLTELARLLNTLPPGRRRVAQALLAHPASRTYAAVAARLGIHLGTVHQHLRRIRLRHPQVYTVLMNAMATSQRLRDLHRSGVGPRNNLGFRFQLVYFGGDVNRVLCATGFDDDAARGVVRLSAV